MKWKARIQNSNWPGPKGHQPQEPSSGKANEKLQQVHTGSDTDRQTKMTKRQL